MPFLVILAELATIGFFAVFVALLASDGLRGPVFAIDSTDPVSRALIRSAQAAFVIGYGVFFLTTVGEALDTL